MNTLKKTGLVLFAGFLLSFLFINVIFLENKYGL